MADRQSRVEQRLAERNATIADNAAKARLLKARFDSQRASQEGEEIIGGLTTQLAKSGARLDTGAPIALLAEQAGELDLDQTLISAAAHDEASQFTDRATMLRFAGRMARRKGKNLRMASVFAAIGQAASIGSQGQQQGFFGGTKESGGTTFSSESLGTNRAVRRRRRGRSSLEFGGF
jgi:hypothetical protein